MLRISLKHCRTEPDWPKGSLESQKLPNWDIVAKAYLRIKSVLTDVFQTCHPKQLDNDKLAALPKPLSFTGECSKQSHLRQELYKPHWMEHQCSSCIVEIQILTDVGQTLCSFTEERETRYFVWNSIKCLSAILCSSQSNQVQKLPKLGSFASVVQVIGHKTPPNSLFIIWELLIKD